MGNMRLRSSAFEPHKRIPDRYSGYGDNVSPALEWSSPPGGVKEFALICHDPDAPLPRGFTHWVIYGMPPDTTGIAERGGGTFTQGPNGTGNRSTSGPCRQRGTACIIITSGCTRSTRRSGSKPA